jgi:hypothetical protein
MPLWTFVERTLNFVSRLQNYYPSIPADKTGPVSEWHLNSLSDLRAGVMIREADVLEPLEMQTAADVLEMAIPDRRWAQNEGG